MPEVEFKENKQLVEELCRDQYHREILRFFARHPYARFDKQVLMGGLGLSDTHRVEMALEALSGQKLLETKSGHGAPLYWLTKREPVHSAVKSVFTTQGHQPDNNQDRMTMMQLIMPLSLCSAMAHASK